VDEATQTFDVTACVQAIVNQAGYTNGVGLRLGPSANVGVLEAYDHVALKLPTLTVITNKNPYYLEMGQVYYDDDPNQYHGWIECTARWAI
jgi:hypothetical protein